MKYCPKCKQVTYSELINHCVNLNCDLQCELIEFKCDSNCTFFGSNQCPIQDNHLCWSYTKPLEKVYNSDKDHHISIDWKNGFMTVLVFSSTSTFNDMVKIANILEKHPKVLMVKENEITDVITIDMRSTTEQYDSKQKKE